jgi:hypothetical protein
VVEEEEEEEVEVESVEVHVDAPKGGLPTPPSGGVAVVCNDMRGTFLLDEQQVAAHSQPRTPTGPRYLRWTPTAPHRL